MYVSYIIVELDHTGFCGRPKGLRTRLPAGSTVPIGWVAVGEPAEVLFPDDDPAISALLAQRGFSSTVFGLPPSRSMKTLTTRYGDALGAYAETAPSQDE